MGVRDSAARLIVRKPSVSPLPRLGSKELALNLTAGGEGPGVRGHGVIPATPSPPTPLPGHIAPCSFSFFLKGGGEGSKAHSST
jgi:hypothetical protein